MPHGPLALLLCNVQRCAFIKHVLLTPCALHLQDKALARNVQRLFASPSMRVNTTSGEPGCELIASAAQCTQPP